MREAASTKRILITRGRRAATSRERRTGVLLTSLILGTLSLIGGLGISLLSEIGIITSSRVSAYMTVALLFVSFVLMFLVAHCLDKRDAARKAERAESLRAKMIRASLHRPDREDPDQKQ